MDGKKNYNVILSVEDSEKWKAFCIEQGITWHRTEYYDKRYCQIIATESEKELVDHFLEYGLEAK